MTPMDITRELGGDIFRDDRFEDSDRGIMIDQLMRFVYGCVFSFGPSLPGVSWETFIRRVSMDARDSFRPDSDEGEEERTAALQEYLLEAGEMMVEMVSILSPERLEKFVEIFLERKKFSSHFRLKFMSSLGGNMSTIARSLEDDFEMPEYSWGLSQEDDDFVREFV